MLLTNRSVVISHSILGANAGLVGAATLALDSTIARATSVGHNQNDERKPFAMQSQRKTGGARV